MNKQLTRANDFPQLPAAAAPCSCANIAGHKGVVASCAARTQARGADGRTDGTSGLVGGRSVNASPTPTSGSTSNMCCRAVVIKMCVVWKARTKIASPSRSKQVQTSKQAQGKKQGKLLSQFVTATKVVKVAHPHSFLPITGCYSPQRRVTHGCRTFWRSATPYRRSQNQCTN